MRTKRRKLLPKPPGAPPELLRKNKQWAEYDMAYFDALPPRLRAAINTYQSPAFQVEMCLAIGKSEDEIIAALIREAGSRRA